MKIVIDLIDVLSFMLRRFGVVFLCIPFLHAAEETSPNIILLMSDDQGWGDVGFNDNGEIKTPYLDEMASQGVKFDRFYAAAPLCSPTRGSCLTGRYPFRRSNRSHRC